MKYKVVLRRKAQKDLLKLKQAKLAAKTHQLLRKMQINPWVIPPGYEKLTGRLAGVYSRRLNRQHRLVYDADEEKRLIIVYSMWSHYE
jgi:Txe/YoeB family toxin of toxin-antitoxin system